MGHSVKTNRETLMQLGCEAGWLRCACVVHAQLIREKYWEYEYEEVVTPNLYNFELWERSGHADHYKDNMFLVDIEEQQFGLKPMNCPGTAFLPLYILQPFYCCQSHGFDQCARVDC